MLGAVTKQDGSYKPTFDATGKPQGGGGQNVMYIDFTGVNGGQNPTLCHQSMFLFRQSSTSDSTTFYGFWNTGRYSAGTGFTVAIKAVVNINSQTVDFTLPTWSQAYPNVKQRTGEFLLKLDDPENVFQANSPYFSPSGGGGSATGGTNCLETAGDNAALTDCLRNTLGNPIAQFSNAATILFAGEIYTASGWGNVSNQIVYNLTNPSDNNRLVGGHTPQLIMDTTQANTDINMDSKGNLADIRQMQNAIDNPNIHLIGLEFDNYDSPGGNKSTATIKADDTNIKEWATYYKKDDVVSLIFQTAGSNEQPYFGVYARDKGKNTFSLPGSNWGSTNCQNLVSFDFKGSDPAKAPVIQEDGVQTAAPMAATWLPTSPDSGRCTAVPIQVIVTIDLKNDPPTNTNAPPTTGTSPTINCSVTWYNPLSWFLCPLATALETVVSGLDNEINNYMDIKAGQGSYDLSKPCSGSDQWCYYYQPWSVIRDISLALTVVFALIAIVSQAFGFELLDAYTLRKVLPRLLIAIIGITLSWPLMMFFINLIDAIGLGVRGLIYAPFGNFKVALGGGGQFVASFFAVGAITALGFAGLLSFVATAALAVAVAFLVLTLRQMVIYTLVIFAPLAILCYTLPNTQKAWKLWWDSFSRGLLMFPIIAAFIAIGRVFAAVNSKNAGSINQIVSFTAYFAPYFLIPFTFRLAGGAIATLGGMVNDRSRGAFDRLRGYRGNKVQQNVGKIRNGSRLSNRNAFSRGFNRVTGGVGTGWQGRFGLGERGAEAFSQQQRINAMQSIMKSPGWSAIEHEDDTLHALTYDSAREARAAGVSERAIHAAETSVGFGRAQAIAAAQQLAVTGTGYRDLRQVAETVARASGGDQSTASAMAGFINSSTKQAGRYDLAPGHGALNGLIQHEMAGDGGGDYHAANIRAARGADAVSVLRGKSPEVQTVTQSLADHARAQHLRRRDAIRARDAATAAGDTVAAAAHDTEVQASTREFLQTMGQIDQYNQNKSYASQENQGHVNTLLTETQDLRTQGLNEVLGVTHDASGQRTDLTVGPGGQQVISPTVTQEQLNNRELYEQSRAPRYNANDPNAI